MCLKIALPSKAQVQNIHYNYNNYYSFHVFLVHQIDDLISLSSLLLVTLPLLVPLHVLGLEGVVMRLLLTLVDHNDACSDGKRHHEVARDHAELGLGIVDLARGDLVRDFSGIVVLSGLSELVDDPLVKVVRLMHLMHFTDFWRRLVHGDGGHGERPAGGHDGGRRGHPGGGPGQGARQGVDGHHVEQVGGG